MTRLIFVIVIATFLARHGAEGKVRLLLAAPKENVAAGRPLSLDISLHNDGKESVRVLALRFASATWSVVDPTGKRPTEAGVSRSVSDHGAERIILRGGSIVQDKIILSVNARDGDTVKVTAQLGNGRRLESNVVTVNFGKQRKPMRK